jgi:hypothetical protein
MQAAERAAQIWAVLTFAASNRQVLTYKIVGRLICLTNRARLLTLVGARLPMPNSRLAVLVPDNFSF